MKKLWLRMRRANPKAIASGIRNAAFVGGLSLLSVGLWWERPSLALISLGTILAASAAWSSMR